MSTMSQSRAWTGPPLFSFGFRPFFLAGSAYAALVMALWVPCYLGALALPVAFDPVTWHVHELLFGYVLAVVAGFLLTAIPNWTGRLPVVGYPLIGLTILWLVGRIAVTISAWLDPIALALLSLAFPVTLLCVIAREVIVGKNTKNLIVVIAVGVLVLAQALMQLAHANDGSTAIAGRLGIACVLVLITIVGGRITPSFTRNWLKKANPGREPSPIGRFDLAVLLVGALSLAIWVFADNLPGNAAQPIGGLLIAAGALHLLRQFRWTPYRTLAEPIVAILHIGYAFVPLGFILSGLALIEASRVVPLAGIHAWSAGAIGVMTLAVMTRATLGHTGRDLKASGATVIIYAVITLAAFARIASALVPGYAVSLLEASAALWCVAFTGFAGIYGRMLLSERV
jgi:uncharacterized protein involved in response to NO